MNRANGTSAKIVGVGVDIPEKVLTNFDLEQMVDTSDEWITERTGIKERRIVADDEATSDIALRAAQRALDEAGVKPEELDLVICGTVTPDYMFPATACIVQHKLGAKRAGAFDLQAGCSSFVYGLAVATQFLATGAMSRVLIIGADCLSRITDYTKRETCVLFGDAAGAAVMVPCAREEGGVLAFELGSDGADPSILWVPAGGSRTPASEETVRERRHFIEMQGREVFKFAVRVMSDSTERVLKAAGVEPEQLSCVIPHQANDRITDAARRRFGLPDDKVVSNVARFGNTSSASVPLALYDALTEGKIHPGDYIVMVAFGAGLTWASMVMKWV